MINPFAHHRAMAPFPDWAQRDCVSMFPDFSDDLYVDDDIVFQNKNHFTNYKGKRLMLVAGGPSSAKGWQDVEYDYLWSMNHFYKNDIFSTVPVDLAMIMGEPNIASKEFKEILNDGDTFIGFEIHDRWRDYSFQSYKNFFCMHTRFYGKIGIGSRMKIFAAKLGFEKVYFTGCDGPDAIFSGNHFFEPGKKTLPSVFVGQSLETVRYHWKQQYDFFWDYIRKICPGTKFENLGGGEIYHEKCK